MIRTCTVVSMLAVLLASCPAWSQAALFLPSDDVLNDLDDLDQLDDDAWLEDLYDPAEADPYEGANRRIFRLNEGFMAKVVDPVSNATGVFPIAVRRGFGNFFSNLSMPVVFVNDCLQLSPRNAARSGRRFLFNSTFGIAGLFDAADRMGWERHESDFGQTLAVYRVASGPYLVLPLLGPTTVRDSFGTLVDFAFRPDLWLLGLGPALALFGGDVWFTYDVERERLEALRDTSVDFYAALRGAYLMDREAAVEQRRAELWD